MAFPDARAAVAALADQSATLTDLREIVTQFPELRPVVAAYPSTDDALLSWLRELRDPAVDVQLAKRASAGQSRPGYETVARPPTAPEPVSHPAVTYGPATYPTATVGRPEVIASAPPPGGAAYSPAQEPAPRPKRTVLPLVLTIVAALVIVGAGIAAAFATGLVGGNGAASTASTQPAVSPEDSSTADGGTSPATGASPSTDASTAPAATGVTCWDGTEAAEANLCEQPRDKDAYWSYLKYVYPSIATHSDCVKVDATGESGFTGVTVMWECELGDALIRYRYWEDTKDARTHYAKKFNAKTLLKTYDLLVGGELANGWAKTDKDTVKGPGGIKRVVVTMFLPDQNISLTAQGNTTKSMWAAFGQVRIRPLEQALGSPSGAPTEEAPLTARAR